MTIEIPLTRGMAATVDEQDGDLAQLKWHVSKGGYASRDTSENGVRIYVRMHRLIASRMLCRPLERHEFIDHADGNSLNNRRSNLRIATLSQNQFNTRRHKDNSSGYKGVGQDKRSGKWNARIRIGGQQVHLGMFDTPELAYAAYCAAAIKTRGEFARLD